MQRASLAAFSARLVALQVDHYGEEFTVKRSARKPPGTIFRLPFTRQISQRTIERYGFREHVSALVIIPAATGLVLEPGDRLVHNTTRDEFIVESVIAPTLAEGAKVALRRANLRL